MLKKDKLKQSVKKAFIALWRMLPILLGVVLLVSFVRTIIPDYSKLFTTNAFLDMFIGGVLGSIFAGNPLVSYVVGGELINDGISLFAITTFLVTWVTVGLVQLPAESILMGKRFAIPRNIIAFFSSFFVALCSVTIYLMVI